MCLQIEEGIKMDGVNKTLYIPLYGKAYVSKKFKDQSIIDTLINKNIRKREIKVCIYTAIVQYFLFWQLRLS